MYFSLVAVLIGSLASAQERQFGTAEWQALVPVASSRQWFVKIGVAFFLALAFFATAIVFARLTLPPGDGPSARALLLLGVGLVLWTSAGLYASSLSTSGVRALALSLVLLLAMTFVVPLIGRVEWWVIDLIAAPDWPVYAAMAFAHPSVNALTQALIAGLVILLLRLAFTNHRSAETGAARVWRQSALLVGYIAVALMINGLVRLG